MSDQPNLLGEYLRARRELVTPEQAGIPVMGTRRVPGLRREEVALLAGISAEYYLRLEQGRDRNPSAQVLESIGRVLLLEDDTYLLGLTAMAPRRRRRRPRREVVPDSLARFVTALPFPAFVEGRYLDVLASNPLAVAISPRLRPGGNRLRDLFLDPAEQALFSNSERAGKALVAGFRTSVGENVDDPRVVELVGELSLSSEAFRRIWARHDTADRRGATLTLHHPQVGDLHVDREKLAVTGTEGMMLVVYHPHPDTDSAEKLSLLSSLAAAPPIPQHPGGTVRTSSEPL
ncbi:helix-turn-helix transcriptional regulator [Kineosporia mesophila]|uniref:Helix-turn-helix transcriptional regulator n=1 Tax=Kineosporia mesophila TaxID=566012 RepID=A0ABP6ZTW3_9ACTN|nr:helix-turn-helix transcriptional regulator [Kineosporia mesophila]MCD5354720.1 helix-turn-helix transcriptional regulator [Kineosporia mesophila]